MNITADLKAFFSFKNHGPKSKKDFYWNYNLSLDDQDDEDYLYEVHTPMVNHALGYYLIVLVIVSVVVNVFSLTVKALSHKKMQAINVLFVALSISDTLLTVLVHPMIIATSFGHDPQDLFSHAGCNWYGFAAVFFGGTNMCIHGTIAYSRYVNILHYKERHNWTRLDTHLRILILCVTIALFFAAAPVFGWSRYETFDFGCTLAFHDPSYNARSYAVICLSTIFVVPLVTCCYCYFRISWYSYETKLKLFTDITLLNDIDVDEAMDKVDPKLLKSISLMERKLLRISFVSALAFMAAWIPFATLCLWEMATPPTQIPTLFRVISCVTCKTATAYNPVIFFFMSPDFREDCRRLYSKLCYKNPKSKGKVMSVAEGDNPTHFSLSVRTEFTTVVVCPLKIILSEAIEEAHV